MALILKRVGRYEVLKEIGRGGMATVFLARQTDLDRHVALKELASLHSQDEAFAERFLRESRMAGSLSHPNIVTVHDYFEHEGTPYISMEYIERGSLRPLVTKMTFAQIAGVLEGLLAGLQHAGSRGIVHRDMKPENVMVTAEGGVKISDFGIGRALNQAGKESRFLTATGTAIGTPAYMAPEQAMAKEVGPWTDLYSLGIMSYEMILGEVPFSDSDTPMSMLVRHVSEAVPPPSTIDPSIDPQLGEWIMRLLQKDPQARPKDAQEAWDRLEEIVIHLVGPRWRREARLPDGEQHARDEAKPLTPAPFSEERDRIETPEPLYVTYTPEEEGGEGLPGVAAGAAAAAAAAAAATAAPPVTPAAAAPAAPAAPAVPEEPSAPPEPPAPAAETPPALELPDEDVYLTFAPGAQKPAPPPPTPPPAPPPPDPEPVAPAAAETPALDLPDGDGYVTFAAPAAEEPPAPPPAPTPPVAPEPPAPVPVAETPPGPPASEPVAEPPAPEAPVAEPERSHEAAIAAATAAGAAAVAAEAIAGGPQHEEPGEERKAKRGLGRLKKPQIPKLPEMPDIPMIPNVPPELQSAVPGLAGEIAGANAEIAGIPDAMRVPTVGQEFREVMPEGAEPVAEVKALGDSAPPGAPAIPKPRLPRRGKKDEGKKDDGLGIAAAAAASAGVAAAAGATSAPKASAAPPAAPPATPPAAPPAAPPPPPDEPPPPPESAAPGEPEPGSKPLAPDLALTVPPEAKQPAVENPSFVLTEAVKALGQEQDPSVKPKKVKPAWIVAAVAAVAAIVAVIVLVSGGGSGKKATPPVTTTPTTTTPTTTARVPVGPEAAPAATDRVSLAGSGPVLVAATPSGAVQILSPASLTPVASTSDPAGPRAVVVSGGKLYLADGQTVTTMRAKTLAPLSAAALSGGVALAAGGGKVVAVQRSGAKSGQICVVGATALSPCASLSFAPSGVAISGTTAYVVDTVGGTVVPYALGSSLTAGTPIPVGKKPHGNPVVAGASLFVAIVRGIAVVDTASAAVSTTVALPATPVSLSAPSGARVFAALYSSNQVAIVKTANPAAAPTLITVGKGPVALASASGAVYVVNAGSGTVTSLNPKTGAAGSSSKLPPLTRKAIALHTLAPKIVSSGGKVIVTVPIAGGVLPSSGLVVKSTAISGGNSSVELWQGGIKTVGGTQSGSGVAVKSTRQPGRVVVALGASAGAFTHAAVALAQGGHSVVITLTPKPAPVVTAPPTIVQTTTTPPVQQTTTTPPVQQTTTTPVAHTTTTPPPPVHTTTTAPPPPVHTTTQVFTVK